MKNDLSLLMVFVTTLFTLLLPIGIGCCGYTTNQIISLMSRDSDFERNPCYIQWKAEQDAKLQQLWKQRDELEKSIARNNAIDAENKRLEDEARRNSYRTTIVPRKPSSVWKIFGIIFGIFVGICFCGACLSCLQDDDSTALPTTTTPRNDVNPSGLTAVSMTPAPLNQTTPGSLPTNGTVIVIGTENQRPFSREADVPLLPQVVINRQNSLPSYDDVMRIPSAPPKE